MFEQWERHTGADVVMTKPGPEPKPIAERFWGKVDKSENAPCWTWKGAFQCHGYGTFSRKNKSGLWRQVLAHRFAYEDVKGPIPEGLSLDHLCRNPACVNPDHLDPVTHMENCRRGVCADSARHPTAIKNRAKTHCPRGHAYDDQNTYVNSRGCRCCKICKSASTAASAKRRKAKHAELA